LGDLAVLPLRCQLLEVIQLTDGLQAAACG
jgi:hypothetical protein